MLTLQQRVEEALKAGHKKAELARAAGVQAASVSHWVQGRTLQVSGESAVGLAKLTGWSPEWWLGKTTVKVPVQADSGPPAEPDVDINDPIRAVAKLMPYLTPADQQLVLQRVMALMPAHVSQPSAQPSDVQG